MVKIALTPDWFLANDVLIEFFSFAVLFIFSVLAIRTYYLNKNRRFLYLGWGFGLITLAQLASIITKLVLFYDVGPTQAIGQAIISSQVVGSVDIFYYAGFFFQRFATLCGLYMIYRLPRDKKSVGDWILVVYFILLSSVLSNDFYSLYHLTALFILVMIISNYVEIYKVNQFANTRLLILAFSLLALSNLIFIFSGYDLVYAFASVIELGSYTIMLYLIVRILKHGKETKPNGNNIGHVGDNPVKKRKH